MGVFGKYIIIRKRTLALAALAIAGAAGYHLYRYHRSQIADDAKAFAGDARDLAEKGVQQAKKVAGNVAEDAKDLAEKGAEQAKKVAESVKGATQRKPKQTAKQ